MWLDWGELERLLVHSWCQSAQACHHLDRDPGDRPLPASARTCVGSPRTPPAVAARSGCGFEFGEMRRSVDDRYVGESLREIAKLPLGNWVVFLGEQAEIVSEREQAFE